MANALLDFVLALARDPAAAARYSADPAGVLAAAGLAGVTAADVNNLMPMVADSLAMSSPGFSGPGPAAGNDPNVWASGAAAVAFEAFGPVEPVTLPGPVATPAPVAASAGEYPGRADAAPHSSADPPVHPPWDAEPDPAAWGPQFPLDHDGGLVHPDPVVDPLIP